MKIIYKYIFRALIFGTNGIGFEGKKLKKRIDMK